MNKIQLVDSFIQILQLVSLEDTLITSDMLLSDIVSEEGVDDLDFELAVICFEATHKVVLDYTLGEDQNNDESLTLSDLIESHLVMNHPDISDSMFIAKRFIYFRDALFSSLRGHEE